jgi:peptidoglycan/xylan/chitin deacetylase (PgdA/CDA1 family)
VKAMKSFAKRCLASRASLSCMSLVRSVTARGGLRVVNFHRVLADTTPADDYRRRMWEPTESEFERTIAHLSSKYPVVPLSSAMSGVLDQKKLTVAVTFDDGYLDNADRAVPILREYNMHCTIFVSTDAIDGKQLWFQKLYRLVATATTPVRTEWDGREFSLDDRAQTIESIASGLKQQPMAVIEERIDSLAASTETAETDDTERMMSWDDVKRISGDGLIEIGSHTVSHPNLTLLDNDTLDRELRQSMHAVKSATGQKDILLAYPNGQYDRRVAAAAAGVRYLAAFTMTSGINRKSTDRHAMHRDYVGAEPRDIDLRLHGISRR